MRQINIKNDTVAALLDEVTQRTGQGKTEAMMSALKLYQKSLEASKRADAAIELVRESIHPAFDLDVLGKAPSKQEQEELLGM